MRLGSILVELANFFNKATVRSGDLAILADSWLNCIRAHSGRLFGNDLQHGLQVELIHTRSRHFPAVEVHLGLETHCVGT